MLKIWKRKKNNNRNLWAYEELFYYYFQRPTCHDIKLKISTNSYIHIGISKITYDENTLNYHLVIVKTPINGKLKYFFKDDNNSMKWIGKLYWWIFWRKSFS